MVVVHVITGLNEGGAEGVLYRLCQHETQYEHVVISLTDMGKYGPMLQAQGLRVECLGLPRGKVTLGAVWHFWRLLLELQPHVVQTWMYHADLLGGVVARLAGVSHVVWGIRHSTLEVGHTSRSTRAVAKLCALLSGWVPSRIVVCAQRAMQVHAHLGYDHGRMVYVPNGYDLHRFTPNSECRNAFRAELGVTDDRALLGMVGRHDPQKDHANLIHALALIKGQGLRFVCVLVGTGMDAQNVGLNALIELHGLVDRVRLMGRRDDVPAIMNALDFHLLSSSSEGFPNVLAEAMACGTPCITTDVGDAAEIVGETGWVVPPKNPQRLAEAIALAMRENVNNTAAAVQRGQACRDRIQNNFDIQTMVKNYQQVWSTD